MLKERAITAVVMGAIFIAILFFSSWQIFAATTGLLFLIGSWEWANLSGLLKIWQKGLYLFSLLLLGGLMFWWTDGFADQQRLQILFSVAAAWWAVSLLWIQGFPSSAVIWGSIAARAVMGYIVILPAWVASSYLRQQVNGEWLVLMVVVFVAAADIGAYFSGRRFGRKKLAPSVSPGKTWEGVYGGVVLAVIIAAIGNLALGHGNWLALIIVIVPTVLVSIVGDLLESMVKRYRGVKDSSQILPGHGGVMDRIDGLTAAAPVFALTAMMSHWQA